MEFIWRAVVSRANDILHLEEKMNTHKAVNTIVKAVQDWGGFTVGAIPLGKELSMNPKIVDKVLIQLAKKQFLKVKSDGVYTIQREMQTIQGIDPSGKLLMKAGAKIDRDPWIANYGR